MGSTLQRLFVQWRGLSAFIGGRFRLDRTALVLRKRRRIKSTGYAEDLGHGRHRIVVRVGYSMADARATLLHEMAHVVAGWRYRKVHTAAWRRVYLNAADEVTGKTIWHCEVPCGREDEVVCGCFLRRRRVA